MDVLLHGVKASDLSAFNTVEISMAILSHDNAGVLFRHDSFGNHLESSGKTIDYEQEIRKFFKVAQELAEMWLKTVIADHKV